MQAQLELLAEVEAVFAAKNSQKLTKTHKNSNLCKLGNQGKKRRRMLASNVFVITNLTFKYRKIMHPHECGSLTVTEGLILF
ncbi:hypothetical protein [Microcoleus sp.]|uniref:hypothetical protein n=1 Tax=Microcoleus sp. TaxID=44472 RepID=UPI0035251AB4